MSAHRSRLWRMLGLTEPMMSVWSEDDPDLDLSDSNIQRITMTRGSGGPSFGPQPHTLEVATTVPRGVRGGLRIHCDLSAAGAAVVASLARTTPEHIATRYFGRIGRQTVNDTGGNSGAGWSTTFYAASWQAQLNYTDAAMNETAGAGVGAFLQQLSAPLGVGLPWVPPSEAPAAAADYGTIAADGDPIAYRAGMRRWASDIGIYVQNCRDGHDRLLPLGYRWDHALSRAEVAAPLTRSQAVSPATWDQPHENMTRTHYARWIGAAGPDYLMTGADPDNPNLPVVEYDMTHVKWAVDDYQPRHVAYAGYNQERNTGYSLPSVTVDLLHLLNSKSTYHRDQARQLLQLEMGDPIFLSGDWHPYLRGVHFAYGITESISPKGWEIQLSLTPSIEAIGEWTPEVKARAWESARHPWDEETRQWSNA